MVTVENKFKDLPETGAYVGFGKIQVQRINESFETWLVEQLFADKVLPSRFETLIVSGMSEHQEYDDKVQWDLRFSEQVDHEGLGNALLHEKRYDNEKVFNSQPRIFSTADYFQITVRNGEKGWVKTGKFPINVRSEPNHDAIMKAIGIDSIVDERKIPPIGIYTDTRRDAVAGFDAALQWQKFRAMATGSLEVMKRQFNAEIEERKKLFQDGSVDRHDIMQHARSRSENVLPFFIQLLPHPGITDSPTSLQPNYLPGALEATLALELEHAIYHQHGLGQDSDVRPISYVQGRPIIIRPNRNGYDAIMRFGAYQFNYITEDKEQVLAAVETELKKYFDVKLSPSFDIDVTLEMSDAHKIDQAIKEGNDNTKLHKWARDFGDAIRYADAAIRSWNKTERPALEQRYESIISEARTTHFSGLSSKLE
ncbi:MAG: hypothetical protein ABIG93_01700 [archaeon]|nr:hypothetical protein [Nanoarchaeota archaeon]